MEKKLILITNDDGIKAEGLSALYTALRKDNGFDIKVVAPDRERSAVGHAITVFDPISVKKETKGKDFFGYAVDGTPADCVKLAIKAILKKKPDLLISGINRGPNVGEDIIYSGTVSAATEGTIYEVPSIAMSIDNLKNPDYHIAAKFAVKMAKIVIKKGLPKKTLLNINIPNTAEDKIKGVKITCQSTAKFKEYFIKRADPRGRDYYWMDGDFVEVTKNKNDDYSAIKNNYISITPVHYDMTAYDKINFFEEWHIDKDMK